MPEGPPRLDVWMSGCPDVRMSGCRDVGMSGGRGGGSCGGGPSGRYWIRVPEVWARVVHPTAMLPPGRAGLPARPGGSISRCAESAHREVPTSTPIPANGRRVAARRVDLPRVDVLGKCTAVALSDFRPWDSATGVAYKKKSGGPPPHGVAGGSELPSSRGD